MEEQTPPIKKFKILHPWRIFLREAFLFSLTLGLGVAAAFKINQILKIENIVLEPLSFWQLILYFVAATVFIFLITILKGFKTKPGMVVKKTLFKGIFILATFFGGFLFLSVWIGDIPALILIAILIFYWFKKSTILIHDLAVILGIAGIAAVLGLRLTPWLVVLLLVILSIYDFIAVYKTKHMIKMAKEMIAVGTIPALILPRQIPDFGSHLREVKPGGKFLILGGGDVAFPLLLCVSLIPEGIINSLVVMSFAILGLAASFWFFVTQKVRRPMPALPPIAFCSIIGFLISLLF